MNKKMRKAIKAIETQQAAERAATAKAEAAAKAQSESDRKAREEAAELETLKARGMRLQLEAIAAEPVVAVTVGKSDAIQFVVVAPINRFGQPMWDAFARSRRIATMRATELEHARLDEEFEREQEATHHLRSFSETGRVGTLLGQKLLPKVAGVSPNGRKQGRFVDHSTAEIARSLGRVGLLREEKAAAE